MTMDSSAERSPKDRGEDDAGAYPLLSTATLPSSSRRPDYPDASEEYHVDIATDNRVGNIAVQLEGIQGSMLEEEP
jgi:hypothetical protein